MFNNPVKPDSRQDEGTVMQIDLRRQACKVVTLNGQKLDNVQWLQPYGGNDRHGDRITPRMGDRVMLSYGLGYPIIVGFLPRLQSGTGSFPLNIDGGQDPVDTGNYAPGTPGLTGDASKPQDMLLGDRVIGSQGGGMIGLLRAGSVLLRSSRASEIFLSRLGDLVRVVSRNFEHFTDASTEVVRNYKGRIYKYVGFSNLFSKAKVEDYQYHQYYGDTAIAEAVKSSYSSYSGSPPEATAVIFKEQVTGALKEGSGEVMRRTLDLAGTEEVVVTNGESFTRMRSTNGVITLGFGDQHTILIDKDKIKIHHAGGGDITMTSSGIVSTFGNGNIQMTSSGINSTFSGHFCNITGSGVSLG